MAFVDGDSGDCRPQILLRSPLVQIVVATSPQGAYQGWEEQASNHTVVTTLATGLWSLHEAFLAGLVLAPLLPTPDWFISLGYSFILVTSLSSSSGSRPRILATIPADDLMLPPPSP